MYSEKYNKAAIEEMIEDGARYVDIGERLGVTKEHARTVCDKLGLKTKGRIVYCIECESPIRVRVGRIPGEPFCNDDCRKSHYKINEKYLVHIADDYSIPEIFDREWTQRSVYAFGLLFSSGSIIPKKSSDIIRFAISTTEASREWIEHIRSTIGAEQPVYSSGNDISFWINSTEFCNRLIELGYPTGSHKTDMIYPDIPEEFDTGFVRGYIEGRGHIHENVSITFPNSDVASHFRRNLSAHKINARQRQMKSSIDSCNLFVPVASVSQLYDFLYPADTEYFFEPFKNRFFAAAQKHRSTTPDNRIAIPPQKSPLLPEIVAQKLVKKYGSVSMVPPEEFEVLDLEAAVDGNDLVVRRKRYKHMETAHSVPVKKIDMKLENILELTRTYGSISKIPDDELIATGYMRTAGNSIERIE
ncbi:MAG: hypothetical protein J4473_03235 [Candidatus Aenigmarchaeota archaeon]|nr:hypothetical protein [Candidatus Aenigmarchaeota archaeon]